MAKTPFGWFPLRQAVVSADTMRLLIAAGAQLPPTMDDIRIIRRANGLLPEPGRWNRHDDRSCSPDPQAWSLFCALQQATTEASGGVHYRQQAVRQEVAAVPGSHVTKHRLMEYNNDPATTLADVRGVLAAAQAKPERGLRRAARHLAASARVSAGVQPTARDGSLWPYTGRTARHRAITPGFQG